MGMQALKFPPGLLDLPQTLCDSLVFDMAGLMIYLTFVFNALYSNTLRCHAR